jgi:hypothetical protein
LVMTKEGLAEEIGGEGGGRCEKLAGIAHEF